MNGHMNVVEVAIAPKTEAGGRALNAALDGLRQSHPGIGIRLDRESGQTLLSGQSEEELESVLSALVDANHLDLEIGPPQVVYLETLSKRVTITHTYKRQMGGAGEFAEVKIEFEPLPSDSGIAFENGVVGGTVPANFIPAIEKGVRREAEGGLLIGFPVTDFHARLVDGKFHELDSNALAFEIAARAAFRELGKRGAAILIEPIMKVEVTAPEDDFATVISDLNSRRAQIHSLEARGAAQVILALVPMSHMLGYSRSLNAATGGRCTYTMTYDHYEAVPQAGDDDNFPGAAAARVA